MKLLLDMNLPPGWMESLAARGVAAVHWSRVGDPRASDREIMEWARDQDLIVVTHNLDFGALLAATQDTRPSVIQFRTRDVLSESLIEKLCAALQSYREHLAAGALIIVELDRVRVRILPLSNPSSPPHQAGDDRSR